MEHAFSTARSLATRTVHIKIHPTAKTISERREVLRVLERFGEVTMFRSLKYHPKTPIPNAFLSLFSSETAAKDAINASPLRYRLISEPTTTQAPSSSSAFSSSSLPLPDSESPPSQTAGNTPPGAAEELALSSGEGNASLDTGGGSARSRGGKFGEKVFELHISPSSFDHHKHLTSPMTNPLHGPFTPVSPQRSAMAASLQRLIPPSLWAAGLRDWETDGLRWRNGNGNGGGGGSSAATTSLEADGATPAHAAVGGGGGGGVEWRVAERERRRRNSAGPRVMKGLRGLKEEGESEREKGVVRPDLP